MRTTKKQALGRILFPLTAGGLILFAGCTPPGPRALLQGERLIREKQYSRAIEKLERAVGLLPDNAQAWNHLGLARHLAGQSEAAIAAYARALEIDTNLAPARFNLGTLRLESSQYEAAVRELAAFTTLEPQSPSGWLKRGAAELGAQRGTEAETSYLKALTLDPDLPEARNGLGLIAVGRSRYLDAHRQFEAALKIKPDYAPALLNAAVVAQRHLNSHQYALFRYRQYLALTPQARDWAEVSRVAEQLEQQLTPRPAVAEPVPQPESVTVAARTNGLRETPPEMPSTQAGEPTETAAAEPHPPEATSVAAAAPGPAEPPTTSQPVPEEPEPTPEPVAAVPEPAGAVAEIEAVPPTIVPTVPTPGPELVQPSRPAVEPETERTARELRERLATQAAASRVEIPRYPYRSIAPPAKGDRRLAERLLYQGYQAQQRYRLNEAMEAYQAAAGADPACFDAYYNLGVAAAEAGDLSRALWASELALAIEPESFKARYNFAVALDKAGYRLDALAEFEALLYRHESDPRLHLNVANLYANTLQDRAKARTHFLRVLALEPGHPQATPIRYWLEANP